VKALADLFNRVREALSAAGYVTETFTFVDATQLISKVNLWKERDKGIEAGLGKLSNANVAQVAADPEARFGRKGNTKWYGYKYHVAVDMTQGLITRICASPANMEDMRGAKHVLPRKGMVFADKAYGVGESAFHMLRRGLHNGANLRNDMRKKNRDLDRWRSGVRMPYEGTFSKFEKRARYRGLRKCQLQAFLQALSHNFKRLIAIDSPPLILRPSRA
jgi:IS5 family transposase